MDSPNCEMICESYLIRYVSLISGKAIYLKGILVGIQKSLLNMNIQWCLYWEYWIAYTVGLHELWRFQRIKAQNMYHDPYIHTILTTFLNRSATKYIKQIVMNTNSQSTGFLKAKIESSYWREVKLVRTDDQKTIIWLYVVHFQSEMFWVSNYSWIVYV